MFYRQIAVYVDNLILLRYPICISNQFTTLILADHIEKEDLMWYGILIDS